MPEVLALPPPTTTAQWASRNEVLLPLYFHHWDPQYADALTHGVSLSYEAAVAGDNALSGWHRWDCLPRITAPTLLVVGRHDSIPHLVRAERAVQVIPNPTLVIMEDSAHHPWLEAPDRAGGVLFGRFARRNLHGPDAQRGHRAQSVVGIRTRSRRRLRLLRIGRLDAPGGRRERLRIRGEALRIRPSSGGRRVAHRARGHPRADRSCRRVRPSRRRHAQSDQSGARESLRS